MKTWSENATVTINEDPNLNAIEMIGELMITNSKIVDQLKVVFKIADAADEQGVANFIAERIDKHQFWNWQLGATLKTVAV